MTNVETLEYQANKELCSTTELIGNLNTLADVWFQGYESGALPGETIRERAYDQYMRGLGIFEVPTPNIIIPPDEEITKRTPRIFDAYGVAQARLGGNASAGRSLASWRDVQPEIRNREAMQWQMDNSISATGILHRYLAKNGYLVVNPEANESDIICIDTTNLKPNFLSYQEAYNTATERTLHNMSRSAIKHS